MTPPLPGREHYPDDTPFCSLRCGRPATEEVVVYTRPSSAFMAVVDPDDDGTQNAVDLCCKDCAPTVRAAVTNGTYL